MMEFIKSLLRAFEEAPGVLGVLGALLGTYLGYKLSENAEKRRREEAAKDDEKRYANLLMLFLDEFVEAFGRGVLYCQQRASQPRRVSHSAIYQPTDSASLAEFVKLCPDTNLHEAVFRLKAIFFQMVTNISKLTEARIRGDEAAVDKYRGAVVAFFRGEQWEVYPVLLTALGRLVAVARESKWVNQERLEDIYKRLEDSRQKLDELKQTEESQNKKN